MCTLMCVVLWRFVSYRNIINDRRLLKEGRGDVDKERRDNGKVHHSHHLSMRERSTTE